MSKYEVSKKGLKTEMIRADSIRKAERKYADKHNTSVDGINTVKKGR